jgi:hypothetical protein
METMHSLTGCIDLYDNSGNIRSFDEMACNCGTQLLPWASGVKPHAGLRFSQRWWVIFKVSGSIDPIGITTDFWQNEAGFNFRMAQPAAIRTAIESNG